MKLEVGLGEAERLAAAVLPLVARQAVGEQAQAVGKRDVESELGLADVVPAAIARLESADREAPEPAANLRAARLAVDAPRGQPPEDVDLGGIGGRDGDCRGGEQARARPEATTFPQASGHGRALSRF